MNKVMFRFIKIVLCFHLKIKKVTPHNDFHLMPTIYRWLCFEFCLEIPETFSDFIVQFDELGNPTIDGCKFRNLGESITIYGRKKKQRERRAIRVIEEMYPQYKGFIGRF